jgi:hypothetical protein
MVCRWTYAMGWKFPILALSPYGGAWNVLSDKALTATVSRSVAAMLVYPSTVDTIN